MPRKASIYLTDDQAVRFDEIRRKWGGAVKLLDMSPTVVEMIRRIHEIEFPATKPEPAATEGTPSQGV